MRQIMRQEGERHQDKDARRRDRERFHQTRRAKGSSKTGECQKSPLNGQETQVRFEFQA